jgi:type I restriction enzyme S subunit
MSVSWKNRKLREVAEIRVSNVDKKTYSSEIPVKLCNYMDVYSNECITTKVEFMDASATPAEIERFGLRCGDVVITKDSETPDDIGIPAVISDEIDGIVCGYHLALIRPNLDELDSVFLAKQLSTSRVARYFSLHASGSTRYGLPISAIETVEILLPPKAEQSKIAEILSTVDRAIEQTEGLIAKQQRTKTGLMQDILTRGIDEHGNLRSEETHEFKDSPVGRIPVEWEVDKLENIAEFVTSGSRGWARYYSAEGALFLRIGNLTRDHINMRFDDVVWVNPPQTSEGKRTSVVTGDLLISITADLGMIAVIPERFGEAYVNQHIALVRLNNSEVAPRFIGWFLSGYRGQSQFDKLNESGAKAGLNLPTIKNLLVPTTSLTEQESIVKVLEANIQVSTDYRHNFKKLRYLKTALMQDLLTGKVRVTPLLAKQEVQ